MSRRSRAREVALQVLYQGDMNPHDDQQLVDDFIEGRLKSKTLVAFAKSLIEGVIEHRSRIDLLLEQTAENWSLGRMAVTDRNVLRIGAFEILYIDTPGRVAINEAVDLAKRFGSKQSSQFVNGILDRLISAQLHDG